MSGAALLLLACGPQRASAVRPRELLVLLSAPVSVSVLIAMHFLLSAVFRKGVIRSAARLPVGRGKLAPHHHRRVRPSEPFRQSCSTPERNGVAFTLSSSRFSSGCLQPARCIRKALRRSVIRKDMHRLRIERLDKPIGYRRSRHEAVFDRHDMRRPPMIYPPSPRVSMPRSILLEVQRRPLWRKEIMPSAAFSLMQTCLR